jgi:hypothetical protein
MTTLNSQQEANLDLEASNPAELTLQWHAPTLRCFDSHNAENGPAPVGTDSELSS